MNKEVEYGLFKTGKEVPLLWASGDEEKTLRRVAKKHGHPYFVAKLIEHSDVMIERRKNEQS